MNFAECAAAGFVSPHQSARMFDQDSVLGMHRQLMQATRNITVAYENKAFDPAFDAGFGHWYQPLPDGNQVVCMWEGHAAWLTPRGTDFESNLANGCQWMSFSLCIVSLIYYGYHYFKATTGWEEVYVLFVEMVKVALEATAEFESPGTMYLNTGNYVVWMRYVEWLMTCPVILIHLSNMTGLREEYSPRTMQLLISDVGTITLGVTAAASTTWLKWIWYLMGVTYAAFTFYHAAKLYVEAFHVVPKKMRWMVRVMAWCYFASWSMFPLLFAFGPEGFKIMTRNGSSVAHTVADVLSKQIWAFFGHNLRVKIHEHIIIHGNLTKTTTVNVAGIEVEAKAIADPDDEDAVDEGTAKFANRQSFLIMRDRMKAQGMAVRATFGDEDMRDDETASKILEKNQRNSGMGGMGGMGGMNGIPAVGHLDPGRVILCVPDISMVEFFRQQFAALPGPVELVPALGPENTLALVQQAMQLGGLDCVLLHPEFLRDKSPAGLVARLRAVNQRVIAFGWSQIGPTRELIESSGIDGYLEGPSFGTPLNPQQLQALLSRIQIAKKQAASMGMMGMGGMSGMSGMSGMGMMGMGMGGMAGGSIQMANMGGGIPTGMMGTNPLFAPPGNATPQTPTASVATNQPSEAEMLQQLMNEINRLKTELGEH